MIYKKREAHLPISWMHVITTYSNLDSFFARRNASELDAVLNEHNELLKILKSHMHKLQCYNHAIVINPDKTPAGEHIRRLSLLLPGQNTIHRQDITGREFRQKLKSLIKCIT